MQKGHRSHKDFVRNEVAQHAASNRYVHALIIKPAIKLLILSALVLFVLLAVPNYIESTLANLPMIKDSGQDV